MLRVKTTTMCRPVKVLKSVASFSDELPKLTKNLPQVALVGRSNVGKSTLLNALLYGNQFDVHDTEYLKRREKEAGSQTIENG
jgi:GTP-binding protein EngB required for normal cell division